MYWYVRATEAQTHLSRPERLVNVAGAFALADPIVAKRIAGRRIVLVDDVTTTGSSLDAAAEPLRAAGAASVWGLAFARPSQASLTRATRTETAATGWRER